MICLSTDCIRLDMKTYVNNGSTKDTRVETDSSPDDANDVGVGMESSGVVYDTARPNKSTSGTSECSHGGHDRCICGMDESRG